MSSGGVVWPFFSYFDLFQNNVALFFNNRMKRSTKIGFFFTITLVILLSYYFTQSDIILKKSPNVVSQTLSNLHANSINFDENHLMSISISDDNNLNYYDPRIFNVVFTISHSRSINGLYETDFQANLELKPCSEDDVQFDPSAFKRLGLKNAYCLKNKTFFLEGYWDEDETYNAGIQLFPCDNITIINDTCKTPEEIANFFSLSTPKYFGTTFHGVALKVDDYDDPMKLRYEYLYMLIDLPFFKKMNIFFKNTELDTIDGWLFRNDNRQNSFLRDYYDTDLGFRADDQDSIAQITLYASHNFTQDTRRYQSLIEVLAYMAGLANFYILLCLAFTNIQNYLNSMKIIMNSLYFFQNIEKPDDKKIPKSYKIEPKKPKNTTYHETAENMKPNITEKEEMKNHRFPRETTEVEISSPIRIDLIKGVRSENVDNNTDRAAINPTSPKQKSVFYELENKFNINSTITENRISEKKISNDIKYLESKYIDNKFNEIKNQEKDLTIQKNDFKRSEELTKNFYKLEVGFFEFLKFLFSCICRCQKNPKQKLIEKANKIFMREMDMISILKKIHEVEKLKLIMLNEDQLILFNSLSKPIVFLEDGATTKNKKYEGNSALKMTNYIKNYSDIRRKSKFNNAYENVMKLSTFNEFNRRLMELVDQNIDNFRKNNNVI